MVIQGTNVPLEITFDRDVAEIPRIVVTVWAQSGDMLKKWEKEDMTLDGAVATLPLAESETAAWPTKKVELEAKGLNESSQTIFWDRVSVEIGRRYDKGIRLTEAAGV